MTANDTAKTASLALNRSPYSKGASRLASDLERTTVSKYAPKGWTTIVDHNDNIQIIDDRERVVATVTEDEEHNFGSEKVEANAKLIAAAPALLQVCQAIAARHRGEWDHPALVAMGLLRVDSPNQTYEWLTAALTLATGGAK